MIKHHVYYVYLQKPFPSSLPIGSMYGIYANIGGILMGSMLPYIAYMDPMGYKQNIKLPMLQSSVPPPPPVPSGPAPATGAARACRRPRGQRSCSGSAERRARRQPRRNREVEPWRWRRNRARNVRSSGQEMDDIWWNGCWGWDIVYV